MTTLNPLEKTTQLGVVLQAPANVMFTAVLTEQQAAGVNHLKEILKAHIDNRLGEHRQRAVCRQLEGLKVAKKP